MAGESIDPITLSLCHFDSTQVWKRTCTPLSYFPAEQLLQAGRFDDGLQLKDLRDTKSTESHMSVLQLQTYDMTTD